MSIDFGELIVMLGGVDPNGEYLAGHIVFPADGFSLMLWTITPPVLPT